MADNRLMNYLIKDGVHAQQQFLTELEIRTIMALLSDLICWRCEIRYRDHRDADHLFYDDPQDAYLKDRNCPLSYEPSGEDFLSPCLAEADVVRRILPAPLLGEGVLYADQLGREAEDSGRRRRFPTAVAAGSERAAPIAGAQPFLQGPVELDRLSPDAHRL